MRAQASRLSYGSPERAPSPTQPAATGQCSPSLIRQGKRVPDARSGEPPELRLVVVEVRVERYIELLDVDFIFFDEPVEFSTIDTQGTSSAGFVAAFALQHFDDL